MRYCTDLPWPKINDFLLKVGQERTSQSLCTQTLFEIAELIPYDIGALFLLDETGKSYKQILIGMEPKWGKAYIDYYYKIEDGRFSYFLDTPEEKDWNDYRNSEFTTDYIKPQKIKFSATIKLLSADHYLIGAIALNRSCRSGFSECEKGMLRIIRAHLSNLHSNLFVSSALDGTVKSSENAEKRLTRREKQITDLLC
ncbi:MAG: hypothetical protein JW864_18405, partial [Spirochaetes bacterium]|nr:hypothetical protein [Spirochaetota bacterium]